MIALLAIAAQASVGVLLGVNSAFDGDPASLSLSGRWESRRTPGDVAASFLLPVHLTTSGESSFGVSSSRFRVDVPPSLRLRLFPESPVRGYGDLGLGLAIATTKTDGWLVDDSDTSTALLSRAALGVEVGPTAGPALCVEPLSVHTTYGSGATRTTLGLLIGVTVGT